MAKLWGQSNPEIMYYLYVAMPGACAGFAARADGRNAERALPALFSGPVASGRLPLHSLKQLQQRSLGILFCLNIDGPGFRFSLLVDQCPLYPQKDT